MSDPILLADHLLKKYGDFVAVDDVTISVLRGEIFSLLGPNGAGKTTTISMLSCLIQPTSGTAEIAGRSILHDSLGVRGVIGVVPQEIALYDELSARRNLMFWGNLYNMHGKDLDLRVDEVLEQVGLADRATDRIKTYSGGMKRRVNIAAGLLHKPQLLFMDEPTVGIDPQSRRRILDMILELRAGGTTILYTTHYMEEAEEISDRVGIIDHGRLIALGTQQELTRMVGSQETLRLNLADEVGQPVTANNHEAKPFDLFAGMDMVTSASRLNGEIIVNVTHAGEALPDVLGRISEAGIRLRSVEIEEPNLEAVFLHLTGRGLRD